MLGGHLGSYLAWVALSAVALLTPQLVSCLAIPAWAIFVAQAVALSLAQFAMLRAKVTWPIWTLLTVVGVMSTVVIAPLLLSALGPIGEPLGAILAGLVLGALQAIRLLTAGAPLPRVGAWVGGNALAAYALVAAQFGPSTTSCAFSAAGTAGAVVFALVTGVAYLLLRDWLEPASQSTAT